VPDYDAIIVGAGHNGLVCAAYLAKAGQRVLVLEASDGPGGLAAEREFHPGFKAPVAHSIGHFPGRIARDLDLASHGLSGDPSFLPTVGLDKDGRHVAVTSAGVTGVSDEDTVAYAEYRARMKRFAGALAPFWLRTMPRIGNNSLSELMTFGQLGLGLRRLGRHDMREFLRIASLPVRDLLDESFDNELLKATLSWDGLIGSKMAPRSPNSAVLALLYRLSGDTDGDHWIPAGGVQALVDAIAASATASGAEIRYSSEVARIMIDGHADGLRANGVHLADGATISADRVISATDPKRTFINLVGVEYLDIGFTNRIRRIRSDGYVAKLHLALNGAPAFTGLDSPDGRLIIAPEMDAIEFAYDDAKYGECSNEPVMEVVIPSLQDARVAPDGQHVLSAHVMFVPYALKGGWTDAAREAAADRAVDQLSSYAPGLRELIVAREFLTPADLEQQCHATGGHWHHGDFAMDQLLMMRPTYEAAQYSSPIPGLHLCGAGSHPGGDLTGAAGHNAAREILR
jgi:phytoene dehydrogenase-like protein